MDEMRRGQQTNRLRHTTLSPPHISFRSFLVSPPFGRLVSYGTEPKVERRESKRHEGKETSGNWKLES